MSHDRYGEQTETRCTDPRCGNGCPKGWVGYDDERRPIPCLQCKPHLAVTVHDNDFAERTPSAKAQAAIDAANERENNR